MKKIIALLLILPALLAAGCKKTYHEFTTPAAETENTQLSAETNEAADESTERVYCGNTQTTVQICETFGQPTGEEYTFMFGPSVTLTDLLIHLEYDPGKTCKCCDYDIAVTTEFGGPYYVSFGEAYARCTDENGTLAQADLTAEQVQTIQTIVNDLRAENSE